MGRRAGLTQSARKQSGRQSHHGPYQFQRPFHRDSHDAEGQQQEPDQAGRAPAPPAPAASRRTAGSTTAGSFTTAILPFRSSWSNTDQRQAIVPVCYHKNSAFMLRFETAGESHGECLVATLTGLPAGIPISLEAVNRELWRRQQGFGRGGRMKIETDRAEIVAGVRHSHTIGSPIAILIRNKDWKNWTEVLPVEESTARRMTAQAGHAPAPGPRRSGGRHQVQFSRCPLYSGTRQRARDHRAGGGRRARQGASAGIRHRGAEPRDRVSARYGWSARPRGKRLVALSQQRRGSAGLRGRRQRKRA